MGNIIFFGLLVTAFISVKAIENTIKGRRKDKK